VPPLFSVVIPVYNRPDAVCAALESVFAQTETDYEVIVADDGSTDETPSRLACYGDRITVLRQRNAGAGAARNLALARARGSYVAFLDSDDLWFPWTLACYRSAIERTCRPAFVSAPYQVTKNVNPRVPSTPHGEPALTRYEEFYSVPGNPFFSFTSSSVALRKDALAETGAFMAMRANYEDMDLWLKLGDANGYIHIDEPVCAIKFETGGNLSRVHSANRAGILEIVKRERSGQYPGKDSRRPQRIRLISELLRAASVQFVKERGIASALIVYAQIFAWNLELRRWRYLLGFPAACLWEFVGIPAFRWGHRFSHPPNREVRGQL